MCETSEPDVSLSSVFDILSGQAARANSPFSLTNSLSLRGTSSNREVVPPIHDAVIRFLACSNDAEPSNFYARIRGIVPAGSVADSDLRELFAAASPTSLLVRLAELEGHFAEALGYLRESPANRRDIFQ
jgi:hypothetical protein